MNAASSDTVLRWWWVRHAPSIGTANLIHGTDETPADLSDQKAIAELANALPAQSFAVTSGVARAAQTYAAFRQVNPELAAARTDHDLDEQDFGEWTGEKLARLSKLPEWDIVQRHPSAFRFPEEGWKTLGWPAGKR